MAAIGDRIRAARVAAGKTQREVAEHLGIDRVSVTQWEGPRASGPERERLKPLADFLNTTVEYLLHANGPDPVAPPERPRSNARIGGKVEYDLSAEKIPVYGQAIGGEDGRFVLNGNKIADLLAPPALLGIRNAYAVFVVGDSMEPRYRAGETVYVHPHMPVRRGDFVVVQLKAHPLEDDSETNDAPTGYVKEFVLFDDRRLKLRQFNPPRDIEFPKSEVISVHKIVLAG